MEIVITARTKAAAELALERLKGIEGITIKTTAPAKQPAKGEKMSPVMEDPKATLKEVKAHQEGKKALEPARELLLKKGKKAQHSHYYFPVRQELQTIREEIQRA